MSRSLIFIELNEFNHQLLTEAATAFHLKNIKKLLALPYQRKTVTEDTYDSGYLEPWVQWVSVHTGLPASEHKIKHLGDVRLNERKQIWERLDGANVTSGVWGAMNALKGPLKHCKFFVPDPWTFQEHGYPQETNRFLGLPRYMARNYLNPNKRLLLKELASFICFMLRPSSIGALLKEFPLFCLYAIRYRAANFVTYSLAEYLSVVRYLDYWRRYKPAYSSVFLNLVAHAQHYYWEDASLQKNDRFKYVFRLLDKILGEIFEKTSGANLLVANALTQINSCKDPPWILYRQNDHKLFLKAIGVKPLSVEALMTHDALIFFEDAASCQNAKKTLESVTVNGKRFFYVEDYPSEPLKLFYMIEYSDIAEPGTVLTWADGSVPLSQYFTPIVRRTAKHSNTGIALSNVDILPALPFPNHLLYDLVLKYFGLPNVRA